MLDAQDDLDAKNPITIEDVRSGYNAAINLWIYEGQTAWARFNVMLVAHSIILALLGFSTTNANAPLTSLVLPVMGILLCLAWWLLMKRAFDYYFYWIWSARELEARFPSNVVKTVSRGGTFAAGKPVTLNFDDKDHVLQMSWFSRSITVKAISQFVILVFAVVYLIVLLQAIS